MLLVWQYASDCFQNRSYNAMYVPSNFASVSKAQVTFTFFSYKYLKSSKQNKTYLFVSFSFSEGDEKSFYSYSDWDAAERTWMDKISLSEIKICLISGSNLPYLG